jgi:hypothetical protein
LAPVSNIFLGRKMQEHSLFIMSDSEGVAFLLVIGGGVEEIDILVTTIKWNSRSFAKVFSSKALP